MMKRSVRTAIVATLLGTASLVVPIQGASAQVGPPLPPEVQSLVDNVLDSVGAMNGSLAPTVSVRLEPEANLYSFGAAVQLPGSYNCSRTLDVDTLPHMTTDSVSFVLTQAQASDNGPRVTHASQPRSVAELLCDGRDHEYFFTGQTDGPSPLLNGPAQVFAVVTACDLLGCTSAIGNGAVDLVGEGYSSTAPPTCAYKDAGNGAPIRALKGSRFTDSLRRTYRVGDDCTLYRL